MAEFKKTRFIDLVYDLSSFGTSKELALVFGFAPQSDSRLLIFTNAGLLSDETLVMGDNQLLLEVEVLNYIEIFFVHAGGDWLFRGIDGYVV